MLGIEIGIAIVTGGVLGYTLKGRKKPNDKNIVDRINMVIDILDNKSHSPLLIDTGDEYASDVAKLLGSPIIINPQTEEEKAFCSLIKTLQKKNEDSYKVVGEITLALGRIARGELDHPVSIKPNTPLYKELVKQVILTKENLFKTVTEIQTGINNIKDSNYIISLDKSGVKKELYDILDSMNRLGDILSNEARADKSLSVELDEVASELNENIQILSSNSTDQAANLEETAATVEIIAKNIQMTSEKTKKMSESAVAGLKISRGGLEELRKTTELVNAISAFQTKIDESTKVIEQIAFQTNILSLNAAVEAATAGEHGRGFAVVATEVRNLAAKSAEAATRINNLVLESIAQAKRGSELANQTLESFTRVVEEIEHTQRLVSEVEDGIEEQTDSMGQISETMNQLDTFTQENARIANTTTTLSSKVNSLSNQIKEKINAKIIKED